MIVLSVLRSGGDYDAEDVVQLCRGVRLWAGRPVRFVCLSDVPLPPEPGLERLPLLFDWLGWWAKLEVFRPSVLPAAPGPRLYLDLDTVINGDVTEIQPEAFAMLSDFYRPDLAQSGVMAWPEGDPMPRRIWRAWMRGPTEHMHTHRGDGEWIRTIVPAALRLQDAFPGQIVSYKVDVKPRGATPSGARVICFHGQPRPRSLQWKLPPP